MTGISIGFDDRTARNDAKLYFGTNRDYSITYNSTKDEWQFIDEGSGNTLLRATASGILDVASGPLQTNQETFLGQTTTPASIPSGTTAFYTKDDGNLYKKPSGGTEEQLTSGSTSDTRVETQDANTTLYTDTSILDLDSTTALTVTDAGSGEVVVGSTDTRVESQDSGTSLYSDTTTINFDSTTAIDVTDDGSGQITIGAASGSDTRVETQDANTTLYTDTSILDLDSTTGLTVTDAGSGEVVVGADRYTNEEAQDAVGLNYDATMAYDDATPSFGVASGGVTNTELASAAVTLSKIDASAGTSGQFLRTDGTTGGASWQTLPGVTVGAAGDYQSIQAAHDNETPTDIWILSDYSESNDTFPISVTKEHVFRGLGGNDAEIDLGTTAAAAFQVNLESNEFPGPKFKNLEIINGDTALDIVDSRYTQARDCRFESQASDAVKVRKSGDASPVAPISTRFINCQFEDAGGMGLNAGSDTHGLTLINCVVEQCTGKGVDLDDGTNIGFYGCSIQLNGDWGLDMGSTWTVNVHKCYFEDNDGGGGTRDIQLGYVERAQITNCYFQGFANNDHAIIRASPRSGSADISNCLFNDYTAEGIELLDGSDQDVHLSTHTLKNATTGVLGTAATRTRSDGEIIAQDLSTVTGQRDGDKAIDDGTNTTSGRPERCVWDATNSVWFSQQGDTI